MSEVTPTQLMQCMEVWGGNQPVQNAVKMAGLDAWVYSRPVAGAPSGGDVYFVSACASDRILRLLIADVSGHGTAVGNLAIQLRRLMRRYVNHVDHLKFVRMMNLEFSALAEMGLFATAIVSTYFAPTRRLTLCNAGHPPPLIYRADEKAWSFLSEDESPSAEPMNLPLGIMDAADYETFDQTLNDGDIVLCHTDCLMESHNSDGTQLGQEGLLRLVRRIPLGDIHHFIPKLLEVIAAEAPGNLTEDDVTILVFSPNSKSGLGPSFGQRISGSTRALGKVMREMLHGRFYMPMPDFRVANIGGMFFPPLNRLWRAADKAPRPKGSRK